MKKLTCALLSIIIVLSMFLTLIVPVSATGGPTMSELNGIFDKRNTDFSNCEGLESNGKIIESSDGIYNPAKAVAYARAFTIPAGTSTRSYKYYNPYYTYFTGADCANFVSQCLLYGGLESNNSWHPESGKKAGDCSYSWKGVTRLFNYLTGDNIADSSYQLNPHLNFPYLDVLKVKTDLTALKGKSISTVESQIRDIVNNANQKACLAVDIDSILNRYTKCTANFITEVYNAFNTAAKIKTQPGDVIVTAGTNCNYGHAMIISDKTSSNALKACGHTNDRYDLLNPSVQVYVFLYSESNYTIEFDANGGTGNVPETICQCGNDNSVIMGDIGSAVPTRDGYVFMGWSATPIFNYSNECIVYSSSQTVNSGAVVTSDDWSYSDYCDYTGGDSSNKTLTLYAQWASLNNIYIYTIEFDVNGGSGNIPNTICKSGYDCFVTMGDIGSAVPTRDGYVFMGWSANPTFDFSNECIVYLSSQTVNSDAVVTRYYWSYSEYCDYTGGDSSNTTLKLYAQWRPRYAIEFDKNGGEGSIPDNKYVCGNNWIVKMGNIGSEIPTRDGYVFMGWSSTPNGDLEWCCIARDLTQTENENARQTDKNWTYYDYCLFTGANPDNTTLRLYAQWMPMYTIVFDRNGGIGSIPGTICKLGVDDSVTMGGIGSEVPTRDGYIFMGWSVNPNFDFSNDCIVFSELDTYNQNAAIANGSWSYSEYCDYTGGDSSNKTLTLYAQWASLNDIYIYTIEFDVNGGSGNIPNTICKSGYDCFVKMGDIGSAVPTRDGYVFMGWSANPTFDSSNKCIVYLSSQTVNSDAVVTRYYWSYSEYCDYTGGDSSNTTLKLYAQWRPRYAIEFDKNGGEGSIPDNKYVCGNNEQVQMGDIGSEIPTRDGYVFMGWGATPTPYDEFKNCIVWSLEQTENEYANQTNYYWRYFHYCIGTSPN